MTTTLTLHETGGPVEARLTDDQEARLTTSELVQVTRKDRRGGIWRVYPKGYVGTARVGDIYLHIKPKTPINRLLFLFGYAQHRGQWRDEDVDAGEHPDLLSAVAHAFARATDRALRQGVLHGYREREETLPVVRGRIREADQLRRRSGLALPIEVRYDDYTTDIPENQLIQAATERLLRLPALADPVRARLRQLLTRLVGVSRLGSNDVLPRWQPSRLNARYHVPLGLAELTLRGGSYELDDGCEVRVDGLLLNVATIFEDFVTQAFTEALTRTYGGRRLQRKHHFLDEGNEVPLQPDLVWERLDGNGRPRPSAVIDAKYKMTAPAADLYQMLAYCTGLGLRSGQLIYASLQEPDHRHRVRHSGIYIGRHALHLDQPPAELLRQVDGLAADVTEQATADRAAT